MDGFVHPYPFGFIDHVMLRPSCAFPFAHVGGYRHAALPALPARIV